MFNTLLKEAGPEETKNFYSMHMLTNIWTHSKLELNDTSFQPGRRNVRVGNSHISSPVMYEAN